MSYQQTFLYLIIFAILYAIYSCYKVKTRVLCTITRRDKTKVRKWAKAKNGYRIEVDKGWYYVNMRRITLLPYEEGVHLLFPTMARCLEFRYNSTQPIDPETGENDYETPQSRRNLNKTEDIEALEIGSKKALGTVKAGGILGGGWMSLIMVVGILLTLYFVYTLNSHVNSLGNAINVLQTLAAGK